MTIPTAKIDTGADVLMKVNSLMWITLSAKFGAAGFTCKDGMCYTTKPDDTCSTMYSGLKPITVHLGSNAYVIPPEGYTQDINNVDTTYVCFIAITKATDDAFTVIGTQFFANFMG